MASWRIATISFVSGSRRVFLRIVCRTCAARSGSDPNIEPILSSFTAFEPDFETTRFSRFSIGLLMDFPSLNLCYDRPRHAPSSLELRAFAIHSVQEFRSGGVDKCHRSQIDSESPILNVDLAPAVFHFLY